MFSFFSVCKEATKYRLSYESAILELQGITLWGVLSLFCIGIISGRQEIVFNK